MTPTHLASPRLAALLAIAIAAPIPGTLALAAQTPAPTEQPAKPPTPGRSDAKVVKVSEWPALTPADRDRLPAVFGQLKKDSATVQQAARDALVAIGIGAMPYLLQQVNDREAKLNDQLFQVFDRLLDKPHAALMAREVKKPKLELRKYLMQRMCRFVDADLQPVLKAATADKDEDVVFYAQLGLAGLHDETAIGFVLENTRKNWDDRRTLVAAVLPAARCEACGKSVAERIAKAEPTVQAAGLRLLRYLATPEQQVIVRGYLTAQDHVVVKEAVNAMRVLHGEEAIENLDAFKAIGMAKEWQSK